MGASTLVPTAQHLRVARRLVTVSRRHGAEAVHAILDDVGPENERLIAVALTRMLQPPPPPRSKRGRPPIPNTREWTYEEAKAANARFQAGERDALTVEGKRNFKRFRRRAAREQAAQEA